MGEHSTRNFRDTHPDATILAVVAGNLFTCGSVHVFEYKGAMGAIAAGRTHVVTPAIPLAEQLATFGAMCSIWWTQCRQSCKYLLRASNHRSCSGVGPPSTF